MDFKCIKIVSKDSSRLINIKGRGGGIVSVRSGLFVINYMKQIVENEDYDIYIEYF